LFVVRVLISLCCASCRNKLQSFFFRLSFFIFFVTAFLCRQSTTKELGEREENSFSISTLFIGKRPDLCGLSGPDGKAIIGNPESKKIKKM
jgi:hypothetical protein